MASAPQPRKLGIEQSLAAEEQAFRRQLPQLLRRHEGQYVAFCQGRLAGHDCDDEALAARLFAELGDQPFYIAKVERKPTVYELPSPELER